MRLEWGLALAGVLVMVAGAAAQQPPATPPAQNDLAARLSDAGDATEYWDAIAELSNGQRFFARYLVTNEGPGKHTAAGVGFLVFPQGRVVSIKFGRMSEDWALSPDRRHLKIASAVLDVGRPTSYVEFDSDSRGFKVHLDFARDEPPVAVDPLPGAYWVDVLPPVPARGTVWLTGMPEREKVEGTLALTHTRMDRSEAELVLRHGEAFLRSGECTVYFSNLVTPAGERRTLLLVRRGGVVLYRASDLTVSESGRAVADGSDYPLAARWQASGAGARIDVRLQREWLRWDPLDIVPQPFRFLLSLQAKPRRVWAAASIDVELPAAEGKQPLRITGDGTAVMMFLQPR